MSVRELRDNLSDALGGVSFRSERLQVTKNGKPSVVIIGMDDFERLLELESLESARLYVEEEAAKPSKQD